MDYINKIKELRKERGYSQADIAEVLETTQQHYSCYENGKNEMPIRHLIKICQFFHVSADWILGLNETPVQSKDNLNKYEIRNTVTGESATVYIADSITFGNK
jgi:transcriptional regulator with XRE-family HTH domain